jgi:hypothetical protein
MMGKISDALRYAMPGGAKEPIQRSIAHFRGSFDAPVKNDRNIRTNPQVCGYWE